MQVEMPGCLACDVFAVLPPTEVEVARLGNRAATAGLGGVPCCTTGRVKAATRGSDRTESQVRACMGIV